MKTKTLYGTTSDHVVMIKTPDNGVWAEDEQGFYQTEEKWVDSGLADPHRNKTLEQREQYKKGE